MEDAGRGGGKELEALDKKSSSAHFSVISRTGWLLNRSGVGEGLPGTQKKPPPKCMPLIH